MRKSAVVSVFVAMLLAGCVSVSTSTTGPSVSATLGVTTPAPSVAVTATPAHSSTPTAAIATATPSVAPTPTRSATPTPTTPVGTGQPTATPQPTQTPASADSPDLVFEDDFTDPTSGWGTVDETFGSASYVPGAFVLSPTLTGAWLFSSRDLDTTESVVRAVGEFSPSSDGSFGMLCGDVAGEDLYGALVGTSGAWGFVHVLNSTVEVLSSDQEAGLDVPLASSTLLAVQCFGTVTGGFRMVLYMSGTGPIATYESADGPSAFDRIALYGEAASDDFEANVFHAAAFAVGGPVGTMSTDATDLVGHVPSNWQDTCFQTPLPPFLGQNATALITCFIADVSAGSDILEYAQFDSKADQDAAYQMRVASFPVTDATTSCGTGPGEHAYHFNSDPSTTVGRLLCAPQAVGIRIDWTDDRLNILSSLADFDGTYSDAFDDWNNGGPNT